MCPDRSSPRGAVCATSATTLELSWPSQLAAIDDAAATIDGLLVRLGGAPAMRDAVECAVREALANAIVHGHREDADRRVELTIALIPDALELTVRDRGAGFDPDTLPDPTAGEHLPRPHGRGVLLIRRAMDGAEWRPRPGGGTELHMIKRWP
jgi:serine/threonine-protein kinase RsbW